MKPKNILITGALGGIGKAIVSELEKENNLFLTSRRHNNANNYFSCDLCDVESINELYNRSLDYFDNKIDVLINCAGQYIYKSIENMTLDEINYLINLNFRAPYILSSLLINSMKKNRWGRIINIGSISGVVGEGNATLYSATKAGLMGLTKSLALEVAPYNISINQINPGWVETELANSVLNEDDKKEIIDVTPQRRFVEPIEVAMMCKYLITDNAKGVCGQGINICAGLSVGC